MLLPSTFGPALRHPMMPAEAARFFAAVAENGARRRVLLLRPSKLPGWPACAAEAARLREAIEPVIALPGVVWNELPDGDHLAIWRRGGEAEVAGVEAATVHAPGVAAVFDVPADLAPLQLALAAIAAEHGHAAPSVASGPPPAPATLADIAAIERVIGQVELVDRLAAREVWRFEPGMAKVRAMRRFTLDLQALLDALVPGRTLAPEPLLRARLSRLASRRLLAQLCTRHELAAAGAIMIPMDAATILSPEFARFDAALPARLRGRVVLDIPLAQAVASPSLFTAAARIAAAAEMPVCLCRVRARDLAGLGAVARAATWIGVGEARTLAEAARQGAVPPALLPRMVAFGVAEQETLAALAAAGVAMLSGPAADAA
jgi:hypothetical protein